MKSGAEISADGKYRYKLVRHWNLKVVPAVWVMLNASTADTRKDDRTIRLCNTSAMKCGFGCIGVYNLFALRTAHPEDLELAEDLVGAENERWLCEAIRNNKVISAAWGSCSKSKRMRETAKRLTELLSKKAGLQLMCLG